MTIRFQSTDVESADVAVGRQRPAMIPHRGANRADEQLLFVTLTTHLDTPVAISRTLP